MNTDNAPFSVGQQIVALINSKNGFRIKDNSYTVLALHKCKKCKRWTVDIGDKDENFVVSRCCVCATYYSSKSYIVWHNAKAFAPIEHQYQNATKEIAETFKETFEQHDQKERIKPERVLN